MDNNNGIQFAVGLGVGIAVGVIATILLTPQAGEQTRRQLRESALQGRDTLVSRLLDILEDEAERMARRIGDELLEVGRSIFEERQAQLRAGMDGTSDHEPRRA